MNTKFKKAYFADWYDKREDDREVILENYLKLALARKSDIKKVLDVGCAYGQFLKVGEDSGLVTCGIDISKFALKKAQKNVKAKLYLFDASKTKWPIRAESLDLVTAFDLVEHLESCEHLFSESFRVLKKGGLFFYTTPSAKSWIGRLFGRIITDDPTHINKHGPEYWKKETEKFGFKEVEILGALIYGFPPSAALRNKFRGWRIPVLTKPLLISFLPLTTTLFIFARKGR